MKSRTNISIDTALLKNAKEHKINLSSILAQALKLRLAEIEKEKWKNDNSVSISTYNKYIRENGVFSEDMRTF